MIGAFPQGLYQHTKRSDKTNGNNYLD